MLPPASPPSFGLISAGLLDRAEGFALERDRVVVGEYALQDGVGQGGATDQIVPGLDGKLAGEDGGAELRSGPPEPPASDGVRGR